MALNLKYLCVDNDMFASFSVRVSNVLGYVLLFIDSYVEISVCMFDCLSTHMSKYACKCLIVYLLVCQNIRVNV